MRESRTYGSMRGARGNSRPYREHSVLLRHMSPLLLGGINGSGSDARETAPLPNSYSEANK